MYSTSDTSAHSSTIRFYNTIHRKLRYSPRCYLRWRRFRFNRALFDLDMASRINNPFALVMRHVCLPPSLKASLLYQHASGFRKRPSLYRRSRDVVCSAFTRGRLPRSDGTVRLDPKPYNRIIVLAATAYHRRADSHFSVLSRHWMLFLNIR